MLSIKLRPIGKKKQVSYRISVMPKRSKLRGKFVDDLGWYNPHTNLFKVEKERALAWLQKGAQPTDSVHNIFVAAGIKEGEKKAVHAKSKKEAPQENTAPQTEKAPEEKVEEASQEAKVEEKTEETPQEEVKTESQEAPQEEKKEEAPETPQEEKVEEETESEEKTEDTSQETENTEEEKKE